MIDLIRQAILQQKPIIFTCQKGFRRIACPHVLGTTSRGMGITCWQTNENSRTGFKPNQERWRNFELSDITSLQILEGPWTRGWKNGCGTNNFIHMIDTVVDPSGAAEIRPNYSIRQVRW